MTAMVRDASTHSGGGAFGSLLASLIATESDESSGGTCFCTLPGLPLGAARFLVAGCRLPVGSAGVTLGKGKQ
eukprot:CAMPEP_0172033522 /NCGR_PEP_ID=MMETSP1041-20130122/20502_1 /TAXON_ID=464988 /ORGANISM="Hemiselmis andersenii, Strain CCMP439" /LENGTH=72 /DNA_ID=CAMNT_0012690343 /DNA_START=292 /DNA_END=510 /DNA_ORIENTATION=-